MHLCSILLLLLVSSATAFKLQSTHFLHLQSAKNFNTFSKQTVQLNDPAQFALHKRWIKGRQFVLTLVYHFDDKCFIVREMSDKSIAWAYVDDLNPYTLFWLKVDLATEDCLQVKQLTQSLPALVQGLQSILAQFNRLDWTDESLQSLNRHMRFQSVHVSSKSAGLADKNAVKLVTKNSAFVNMREFKNWEYEYKPNFSDHVIVQFSGLIRSFFSGLISRIAEALNFENISSFSDEMFKEFIQQEPSKVNINTMLYELSQMNKPKNLEALIDTFSNKEDFERNFLLAEQTRTKYQQEILPLFKGNVIFFLQVLTKQFAESFPADKSFALTKWMVEYERSMNVSDKFQKFIFADLVRTTIARYISDRFRRWEPRDAPSSAFCVAFKAMTKAILEKILEYMDRLEIDQPTSAQFKQTIQITFEVIKSRLFNLRPGAFAFLIFLESQMNRFLVNFYDNSISTALGLNTPDVNLTKQLSYLVSLLGQRSAFYPKLPMSKYYVFDKAAELTSAKYLI